MLDQGGKVSHFNYFSNERTAEAVVNALTQDAPAGFRVIGPLSWAGESSTGVRGLRRAADDGIPASDKPAVFLLPGILGSNLKVGGKRIWLGWRLLNGLKKLDYTGRPDDVLPDGPVGMSYDDLAAFLSKKHQVIEFAFDVEWLCSAVAACTNDFGPTAHPSRHPVIAYALDAEPARINRSRRTSPKIAGS